MIPSILSNMPPWPGIRLLVSLISDFLLKKEITKSPNWLTDEIINIIINKLDVSGRKALIKYKSKIFKYKK